MRQNAGDAQYKRIKSFSIVGDDFLLTQIDEGEKAKAESNAKADT